LTEFEDAAGTYTVSLKSTLAADPDPVTAASEEAKSAAYGNTMIEVTATDDGLLWTTQEFVVRRNRRPEILVETNEHPMATMNAPTAAAVGTTNKEAMTELMASMYFYDDAGDTLKLSGVSVDDDEVADFSVMGDTLTVTGLKAGITMIRLKAVDTGELLSKQHSVTLTVDAGPEASEKPLEPVTSSLSLEATGDPEWKTPLGIGEYFKLNEINDQEGHTYTASSSDESKATVKYDDDATTYEAGDPVVLILKALGDTTITLKVAEDAYSTDSPDPNEPAPDQVAERSFVLTVVE
jgi:hypothetical protein